LLGCCLVADGDLLTDLIQVNTALDQCFAQNLQAACIFSVGASLLAKVVNDGAVILDGRVACGFFAGKLAPTGRFVRFLGAKKRPEPVGASDRAALRLAF
jgi:hypothetical protein